MNASKRIPLVVAALLMSSATLAAEPPAPVSKDAMPAVRTPATPMPSASKSPAATSNAASAAKDTAQPAKRVSSDRLNLDTTVVTGNRELPKVLYIVPWKRSDLGDLPQQPLNTLLDEVLTPVDRDVFRREVTYYGAMTATEGASEGAPATSPAGSEK